jgi:hypothetical protein
MKDMGKLELLARILVIVGAINWGLVAFANLDLVNAIFGSISALETLVYALVALSGIYELVELFK